MSRRFDLIASLVFFVLGVFFVIASSGLASNVIGGTVTPATFPRVFGYLLAGLSVLLFIETVLKKSTQTAQDNAQEKAPIHYKRFFGVVLAMAAYVILIEPLGFIISTFMFLVVTFQLMARERLGASVLIAGVISAVVYFVFIRLLEASVPAWPNFI